MTIESKSKLTRSEILDILNAPSGEETEAIFDLAAKEREENFGKKIFPYGFVYFSTWCRNNCNFCYYRKDNGIDRYRKTTEEVMEICDGLINSGVVLVDLTMGEDPEYHNEKFEGVVDIVRNVKEKTDIPVMISPGVVDKSIIDKFAEAGTDFYALYQETHNRELFSKLRWDQSYDERMEAKKYAHQKGMMVEEGLLVGIGETTEDIADSILTMGELNAKQVRVMSFVPQAGIPMEKVKTPDRSLELKTIAAMRLAYPWALIPASLDVDGIDGLEARIKAGASVVTSIIPPRSGLGGVAHKDMDVDEGNRTVEEVKKILNKMGYEIGTVNEYKNYLKKIR